MNDVHDVYEISSCITEFSIYHWSNVCWKLLLYISKDFRGRNIEKSERNNIHYCESVFLVVFFVTVPAKFRPIEFLRSNREQLRYVHFAYSPLLYLSNIDLTPPIFFTFIFFFNKNITSHSPFFTWLLSIFLSLSTNFLKFIVKRLNESTISWKISFFNLQSF